ncbi:MAG: hypothetical protein D6730_16340 [Bacteroidetes bacterium]|nr:MAG: hypothetical protein D6730_16340 [Bacteroidota bacterium]
MNNMIVAACFVMLALLTASSCKKNDQPNFGGTADIMAEIDGISFSATLSNVALLDSTLNMGNMAQDKAQLQFHRVYKTGSFTLNKNQGLIEQINLITADGKNLSIIDGSYTIDELTKNKAKGTFQGTAYEITDFNMRTPYQITKGTFDARF